MSFLSFHFYIRSTEILCSETPALGNGRVSITPNSDSPYFGLGSVAAYSCNTGFVLVGQTTRVCEDTNGGTVTTGAWSGSAPTCQGNSVFEYELLNL